MKLTKEKVLEALDCENSCNYILTDLEKEEVVERFKKAGIIEEDKYYVLLNEEPISDFPYVFVRGNGRIDRGTSIEAVKYAGSMTMNQIKELDERYVPFAVEIKGE